MRVRASVLAALCCLPLVCSCTTSDSRRVIDGPPPYTFENGDRLAYEFGWFYADTQDTIFGVDYNYWLESRFGGGPYE